MFYLAGLVALAQRFGAVNTVYTKNGQLWGTNTDYHGFLQMLDRGNIALKDQHVLILGSGGASAMVQYACLVNGATKVTIASRNTEKAQRDVDLALARVQALDPLSPEADPCRRQVCSYQELPPEVDLVVNTTPLGTYPHVEISPLDLTLLPHCKAVADLTYNPLQTSLMLQGKKLGMKTVGGLSMLVAQATKAASFFCEDVGESTSRPDLSPQIDLSILRGLEKKKRNIILIGMPGCGKSTLGRDLARRLHLPFVDTDKVVEERFGQSPGTIIQEQGEDVFRQLESQVMADLGKEHGQIIATGGGVVERQENYYHLAHNLYFVYIQKILDKLATKGRPLSKDKAALEALYQRRHPRYTAWADLRVNNNRYYKEVLAFLVRKLES